jgi:hypothetical protein
MMSLAKTSRSLASGAERRSLPGTLDVLLAGCLIAISILAAFVAGERGTPGSMAPSEWWHWLLVAGPSAAVAFRRTAPVRAEAAERVAAKRPEKVLEALEAIGATARDSLNEVRRVLFGLRHDEPGAQLEPVPTLDDIEALVAATASTGLEIDYRLDEAATRSTSATVGAGVYRIVQEALTNVLKHAGPGPGRRSASSGSPSA